MVAVGYAFGNSKVQRLSRKGVQATWSSLEKPDPLHRGDEIVRHPEESGSKDSNGKDEYQTLVHKDKVDEYKALADKSIEYAGQYLGIQCPHIGESDVGTDWYMTH